jgi:AcrR family transcriptional regulator
MPRPPKAREPLKQAALHLFVEKGIHATGIREIARQAGCSEAALYRHWPNKEALVQQLFIEHLEHVASVMHGALLNEGELSLRIRTCCQDMFRLYDEQPLVFRYVLLVQHELARFLPEDLDMPQDILTQCFQQAKQAKQMNGDPVLLSAAAIGIFLQVASYVIYGRLPGPLVSHVDSVCDCTLRMLDLPA